MRMSRALPSLNRQLPLPMYALTWYARSRPAPWARFSGPCAMKHHAESLDSGDGHGNASHGRRCHHYPIPPGCITRSILRQ